jgi:hypothetical protein
VVRYCHVIYMYVSVKPAISKEEVECETRAIETNSQILGGPE